jgi:predicted solute-binding protein
MQYSVVPIKALHGRITAREYVNKLGNKMHLMIRMIFRTTMQFFKTTTIHASGTVQSRFEEHESELQYLPLPAQSPDLKLIEPFWSVFESTVRYRFPLPTAV